jgi:hypothetical protein
MKSDLLSFGIFTIMNVPECMAKKMRKFTLAGTSFQQDVLSMEKMLSGLYSHHIFFYCFERIIVSETMILSGTILQQSHGLYIPGTTTPLPENIRFLRFSCVKTAGRVYDAV